MNSILNGVPFSALHARPCDAGPAAGAGRRVVVVRRDHDRGRQLRGRERNEHGRRLVDRGRPGRLDPGRLDPGGLDPGRLDPGRLDPRGQHRPRREPARRDPGRQHPRGDAGRGRRFTVPRRLDARGREGGGADQAGSAAETPRRRVPGRPRPERPDHGDRPAVRARVGRVPDRRLPALRRHRRRRALPPRLLAHVPRARRTSPRACICRTGGSYKPGTTRWKYGTGTAVTGANPTTTSRSGARWSDLPGTPCAAGAGSRPVELTFDALSGLTLGVEEATASVTMGATTNTTDPQAPVLVTQNWENNDAVAAAPTIQQNRLVVGHIAKSGDVEVFRMPVPDRARNPHDRVPQPHGGGRRLRPRRREARRALAAVQPRRLDPGRLDPGRGRRQLDRQPQRSASARDAAGHPGRLDPGREHLGEPRLRGRGGAGRRRRRGGLLHDHGERLQRLSQRRAVRPARRADASSRSSCVPGSRAHARCPGDACGAGRRHEDALHRQPPADDGAPRGAGNGRHARRGGQGGRQARGRRADPRGRRRRRRARGVRRVGRAAVLDQRCEQRRGGGQRRRRPVPRGIAERALRRPARLRRRAADDARASTP